MAKKKTDEPVFTDEFDIGSNTYKRLEYDDGSIEYFMNGTKCVNAVHLKHVEAYFQSSKRWVT